MGERDVKTGGRQEDLRRFTTRLLEDVRALERMIDRGMLETGTTRIGAEQEMFLVDSSWRAAPRALELLEAVGSDRLTPELARFNLEFNAEPVPFRDDCLAWLEASMEAMLSRIREAAHRRQIEVVLTGILPTLLHSDLTLDHMTPRERYRALNEALNRARGGAYELYIRGADELRLLHESLMLEACNTSFQVHFQVAPADFARHYNTAMAVAAPVLAAAGNSPLLFGKRLWRETRIALFQQSLDTRGARTGLREIEPRVTFGSRWVDESVLEIFQEDIGRFKVLLSAEVDEDSLAIVEAGGVPELRALRLYNSTVYRWNRACYGIHRGVPHLRIENRILPSGPTPRDEVANAAFWLGLLEGLRREYPDIREVLAFADVRENFVSAARLGLGAHLTWVEGRGVPARTLILDRLLPIARRGLAETEIDGADVERYLGTIEARVSSEQTGARWLLRSLGEMGATGTAEQRLSALTAATAQRQWESAQPVHRWSLARLEEGVDSGRSYLRVEQFMTRDIFTVGEDEPLELVAHLMDWHHIRNVPVEDTEHRLQGLVSLDSLARYLASADAREREGVPVREIMQRDPVTVRPDTPTREALETMRRSRASGLPVVRDGRLVGLITESDFVDMAGRLLERHEEESD